MVQYQGQVRLLRPSCLCKTASFATIFIIAGTTSAAAFYAGVQFSRLMSPMGTCLTSSCIRLAENMAVSMDASTNPCDDFYKFACGRATNSAATSPRLYDKDVLNRVQRLLAQWDVGGAMETPLDVSASLYQNCLAATNGAETGVGDLLGLLQKRKIDVTNQDIFTEPLDAVLSLEIRDNIKTIFDIAVERRYVVIKRRRNLAPWFEQRSKLIQKYLYKDYLENTFRVMGTKSKIRVNMLAASVWRSENEILNLSSKASKLDLRKSKELVFLASANGPSILKRTEWKNNLLKFWKKVAIDGSNLVTYLDNLFKRLRQPDMLCYLCWEVIRQLAPFTDLRLRAPEEDAKDTADHCFRAIFHHAGVPALAMVIAQDVTAESIIFASFFVASLVRRVGVNASIRIVDPRQLFEPHPSVDEPEKVTDVSVPFLRAYLKSLAASRQAELLSVQAVGSRRPVLKDLLGHHVSFHTKELSVPTSLLRSTLFSVEAPRGFNYAGLGYEVLLGLRASGALNVTSRHSCNTSKDPGYEGHSLDALLRLINGDGGNREPHKLPGFLEVLAQEQLLFLAFCQKTCSARDPDTCNVPLRGLPAFASTFECQRGSYMRPIQISRCGATSGSR